ncbi:poly(A) RNA polymerase, mitochondrial-like isoform X1 [Pomacea canaliculata]|uniref:poly(A) RNA polymerase, mitochondrial-like isoform X1 n=2 Tax=Pomacea canaliculata TaxID=400727 RepID=UPI000D731411|nr:poly(A) RNA polymerase, mitochondrial-like isoform X1 [Pomacea canaliculata]
MASSLHRCCILKFRLVTFIPSPHPGQNYLIRHKHGIKEKQKKVPNIKSMFKKDTANAVQKSKGKQAQGVSSYQTMLDSRKDEASRSVIIRAHSPQTVSFNSLRAHGHINRAIFYQGVKNNLLVEFEHKDSVRHLLEQVSYFSDPGQMPVQSRLLYAVHSSNVYQQHSLPPAFIHTVGTKNFTQQQYQAADSISAQMKGLHKMRSLSDDGSRLRYFMCTLIEDMLRTTLPHCRVDPFGSSSNGFGWEGSDLDMMLTLMHKKQQNPQANFWFLTKRHAEDERTFAQQCLDVVGDMIRVLMPSSHRVSKILNARVPIVKFHHDITDIECDLSCVNVSGAKMSELMFLMGEMDSRVRLLMTTIKQWAKSCEVTRSHPGPWPSNFMLLSLLIFFLQTRSVPVIPSIRHLQALAEPEDHFQVDGVDYAFVTDVQKLTPSKNNQKPEELLLEFFHYYAHFDFEMNGLSLIEAATFPKPDSAAVFIENPLEVDHNISKNVSSSCADKLKDSMLQALRCLETKSVPNRDEPWGLMCLFQPPVNSEKSWSYNLMGLFADK